MGQRDGFSYGDIQKINRMYSCNGNNFKPSYGNNYNNQNRPQTYPSYSIQTNRPSSTQYKPPSPFLTFLGTIFNKFQ